MEIAVPAFPTRHPVAGNRFHVHIDGEQVVAGVRAVFGGAFQEETRIQTLAELAAVQIGEGQQDRIGLALVDATAEIVECEHSCCGREQESSTRGGHRVMVL